MEDKKNCAVQIAVREGPIRLQQKDGDTYHPTGFGVGVISYPEECSHSLVVDERPFSFDHVLRPEITQEELFEILIRPLLTQFLRGYNCTALAYGQTGTGKSYTMGFNRINFNDDEKAGIIQRCFRAIFEPSLINENIENAANATRDVWVTYIEIYNEKIYDLLVENYNDPVTARDYKSLNGTRKTVTQIRDCYDLLVQGNKNRHVRPTIMNKQSSRSHAIFKIYLRTQRNNQLITSCFNIVDLAGSEGVRRTGHEGLAMMEGVRINQGLLCINKVLHSMATGQKVIPYRDSVLTLVLQDSLNPNSYLTLLACISPHTNDVTETLSTIRFAQSAKHVKHSPQLNSALSAAKKGVRKTFLHSVNKSQTGIVKRKYKVTPFKYAPHFKTFCTPSKLKPMSVSDKRNHSEMGMTSEEKKKVLKSNRALTNYNSEFLNQTGLSLIDTASSFASLNLSSSTTVEEPTNNKQAPVSNLPKIDDYITELTARMETKFMKMISSVMNNMAGTATLPTQIPNKCESFATSSPIFKVPEIPKRFELPCESNVIDEQLTMNSCLVAPSAPAESSGPSVETVKRRPVRRSIRNLERKKNVPKLRKSVKKSKELRRSLRVAFALDAVEEKKKDSVAPTTTAGGPTSKSLMGSLQTNSMIADYIDGSSSSSSTGVKTITLTKHRRAIFDLLNSGSMKELQLLPQIGRKTAYQIIVERSLHGKFKNIAQVEKLPIWQGKKWERFAKANLLI